MLFHGKGIILPLLVALVTGFGIDIRPAQAAGAIAVEPRKVVLEGRQRSEEIFLINRGTESVTYRIAFADKPLETTLADGTRLSSRDASQLLRFSPRQVVIAPGGSQSVRLLVRKPRDLAPGEYLTFMQFTGVPEADNRTDIEAKALNKGELAVRVNANFAVTIPVLIRHGEGSASAALSDLALVQQAGQQALSFELQRRGEHTIFADAYIDHRAADGTQSPVGMRKAFGVYYPYPTKAMQIPLSADSDVLAGGTLQLRVTAHNQPDQVLATAELPLP